MKGMLLAAGLGTRLRPVTYSYAKPAIPFLNIPLMYYAINLLASAGVNEFVVNAHYKREQIARLAKEIPGFKGNVHISVEDEKPLGSGGGVWQAKQWLNTGEDFFIANADEVILPSSPRVLTSLFEKHKKENALATILVMRHPGVGTQFGGVWTDLKTKKVLGFGKQRPQETSTDLFGYHYIGVLALSPRVFKYLPEGESNLLYDALVTGLKQGELVQTIEDQCIWYETGDIASFIEASDHCLNHLLQAEPLLNEMAKRYWLNYSQRTSITRGHESRALKIVGDESRTLIGNHVTADGPIQVKGFTVLGDGVRIGRNCSFEKCVILPGAVVPDGTQLSGSVVAVST